MKIIRTLTISLLFCLPLSFISFGSNSGLSPIKYSSKEQVWVYYTNAEDEYGNSIRLQNQWKQFGNDWFYFGEDGKSKCNTWVEIKDKWYYFNEYSRMLSDAITPDGYTVGSDGAWDGNEK